MNRHQLHWVLGALLGIAVLVRVLLLVQTAEASPFFEPNSDARFYDQWAQAVARGDILLSDDWLRPRPGSPPVGGGEVFHLPPLYPYLLAALYVPLDLLGGLEHRVEMAVVLQSILGLVNLWLIHHLARRLFGEAAAHISLALAVGYAGLVYWEAKLLITTLAVFLSLVSLRALLELADRPTPRGGAATGLLLGGLVLARPNMLPFAVLAALWLLWRTRAARGSLRPWALTLVGLALPLVLCATRNVVIGGDAVLVSDNGGINFFFGNHPSASGLNMAPGFGFSNIFDQAGRARQIVEDATGRVPSPSEASSFFYGRGWEFVTEQPGEWLVVVGRKLRLLLGAYEAGIGWMPEAESALVPVLEWLPVTFAWILALALVGLLSRRPSTESWLLIGYLASTVLVVLVFFFAARLRVPMAAVLCAYAGEGGLQIARAARQRDWRRFAVRVGVAMIAGVGSYLVIDHDFRDRLLSHLRHTQGITLIEEGRLEAAERELEAAVALDPSSSKAADGLARLLLQKVSRWRCEPGDTRERRVETLERAVSLVLGHAPVFPYAGQTLGELEHSPERARYSAAAEAFLEAAAGLQDIGVPPALALAWAARSRLAARDAASARDLLERSRRADPSYEHDPDVQLLEARILAALGRAAEAETLMRTAASGAAEALAGSPPPRAAIVLERVRLETAVWLEDWKTAREAYEALRGRDPCQLAGARVMWLEEQLLRAEGAVREADGVQRLRARRYPRYPL